jgi:hypothetical protein
VKQFLEWLFNEPNGHFAIALFILAACAVAALAKVPGATGAVGVVWLIVLAKLK